MTDLMTFLKNEYRAYLEGLGDGEDDTAVVDEEDNVLLLDSFLEWARKYLAEVNRPVNVTYLLAGLGLVLLEGQTVSFTPQPEYEGMRDDGVKVTRPKSLPGMGGMQDTSSVNIFGGR
jgi:hypothetical protein